jgi:hypothetical protein
MALGVSLLLLGGVILYRLLSYEESMEEVARKCLHYIETGNSRALFRYVSREEKEMLDLDPGKFEVLFQFLKNRMSGFSPKGEAEVMWSDELGYHLVRSYAHPDGRTATLLLSVRPTDRGAKLIPATSKLVNTALGTYVPPERKFREPLENKIYALQKAMHDLKGLPLPGYFETQLPRENPRLQVLSWEEYAQVLAKRWETYQQGKQKRSERGPLEASRGD